MSRGRTVARLATSRRSPKRAASSRLADERLQCVVDLAADFYWEQDEQHRFTVYRPGGEPDAELDGLVGKTSWEFFAEPAEAGGWAPFVATLEQRAEFREVLHCLGTRATGIRYLHFSGQPVFDQRKKFKGYRGIARDVSAQIRAERLAQLEYTIAHTLAEADDVAAGLRVVIRAMCEAQSWAAGNFWRVDAQRDTLWHEVGWSSDGDERRSVLTPGERLPLWLTNGPVWIGDVARDPRAAGLERADATGWHTGLVVPVKAGAATIGVLDFYAPHVAAPEPQFLKLLRSASAEIGHFCQRAIALEKLRESEERVSSTMELAAIGIAHVEDDGRFCYVNPQLCTMLGYTEQELLAMTVKDISHLGDASATDELRVQLRSGAIQSFKTEKRYLRKDGSTIWVGLTIASKRDRAGVCLYDISVVEDISSRKSAEERIQYLATHDGLTGLPNRELFMQLLGLSIETARRYGRKLAVLFIDLDRFKVINDTLGHEAGDVLLREVAARLRECLRASDVVARLGGDEFVVLLQEINEPASGRRRGAQHLERRHEARRHPRAGVPRHGERRRLPTPRRTGQDDQALMKNADMAMYLAKEEGKNNFQFFTSRMQPQSIERLALETNLRRALERDEFSLHYQAKVNFKRAPSRASRRCCAGTTPSSARCRRRGSSRSPRRRASSCRSASGCCETACAQSVAWQQAGPAARAHGGEPVDAPAATTRTWSARSRACSRETGMEPELLELEITESTIMHNAERAVRMLTAIKELGVRLAIDDFGTGYSSLAHLKRFPIDTLKVDRSFIREVPNDAEDSAIAEAIIAMGKTLSLTVVAEGVETPEQQAFLRDRLLRRDAGLLLQHARRAAGLRGAVARVLAEAVALSAAAG